MTNYELPNMKYSIQNGLVSVIVPIYNTNEVYLRECLDSILSQTFANWEAILVNDGSTDNTEKIIDEYVKKDSRFVAIHKQNQGTLLARKTGLENSRGEFIANLDHDDTYNPDFLEKMHSKIIGTNADFVWCKCNEHNAFHITNYSWDKDVSRNISVVMNKLQGMAGYSWNKLIKREIYEKVLFPNVFLTLGEDPVQILQVVYHSKSATFVSENLYFHRDCGISTRGNIIIGVKEKYFIHETLELIFDGTIPYNVKDSFYTRMSNVAYYFFLLNEEERQFIQDKLKPLLPEFIKYEKNLCLKIILSLASKGIEFPFQFYQWIRLTAFASWIRNKKNKTVETN